MLSMSETFRRRDMFHTTPFFSRPFRTERPKGARAYGNGGAVPCFGLQGPEFTGHWSQVHSGWVSPPQTPSTQCSIIDGDVDAAAAIAEPAGAASIPPASAIATIRIPKPRRIGLEP